MVLLLRIENKWKTRSQGSSRWPLTWISLGSWCYSWQWLTQCWSRLPQDHCLGLYLPQKTEGSAQLFCHSLLTDMTETPRDPRHFPQESCVVPGTGKPTVFQPMEADGAAEPKWIKYLALSSTASILREDQVSTIILVLAPPLAAAW